MGIFVSSLLDGVKLKQTLCFRLNQIKSLKIKTTFPTCIEKKKEFSILPIRLADRKTTSMLICLRTEQG